MGVALGLLAALALIAIGLMLSRGILGFVHRAGSSSDTEPDPQFAAEPEQVTRPPELTEEEWTERIAEDHSVTWIEEQTPVDRTAEELAREAASAP